MYRRIIPFLAVFVMLQVFLIGTSLSTTAAPLELEGFVTLLGRPTNNSISVNVIPDLYGDIYLEYGTSSGSYSGQTGTLSAATGEPVEFLIDGLFSNSQYFYRTRFRETGTTGWLAGEEYTFHTQRPPGETFTFTIISDSHMNGGGGNVALYEQTLHNVNDDHPDFHFDLGDTFWTDGATDAATTNQRYMSQRAQMGLVSHSASVFVAVGNHENEEGWNLDDTPNPADSLPVLSTNARKQYYLNPIPDDFYSGNPDASTIAIDGDHLKENFFSWQWGDALFVFIDPYWYTLTKPYIGTAGGEGNDEVVGDRWEWTLGDEQYLWLRGTLEDSDATFKFIFAHHMVGGTMDYVRGSAEAAHLFEWGGHDQDGTTWGFDTERPGWGVTAEHPLGTPIHQLLVDNHVSAFFHGHDHEYVYGERDGVVYQLVPVPSMFGYGFDLYSEDDPHTIRVLPNSGHLRVTVSPTEVTVDYVRSYIQGGGTNGEVAYSYTIPAGTPILYELTLAVDPTDGGTTDPGVGTHEFGEDSVIDITAEPNTGYVFDHWEGEVANPDSASTTVTMDADKTVTAHFVAETSILGDVNGDGVVNSTDALIVLSCDAGLDTTQFCPMNCGEVNEDGTVNSTDALVILSFDAGMDVPYPVGEPGCPSDVVQGPGCSPE